MVATQHRHLPRVPGAVGVGELGARADARPGRARARAGAGRGAAPQPDHHRRAARPAWCTGPTVEHMTARETLERAVDLADIAGVPGRRRRRRPSRGPVPRLRPRHVRRRPRPVRRTTAPRWARARRSRTAQQARARLEPDGTVTLFTSQQPHGQGHETTLAQLAADGLGLALDAVHVVHGDTTVTPFNAVGTGGSRAATLASGAVVGARPSCCRVRIAEEYAARHEVAVDDVEVDGGAVRAARGARAPAGPLARLAGAVAEPRRGRPATSPSRAGGWTQATHCCWVEVDTHTGLVRVLRHLVVEDCGAHDQPDRRRGPDRGRRRAGARDRAARAHRVRRHGPAAVGHTPRLPRCRPRPTSR